MSIAVYFKEATKNIARSLLPLPFRKRLAICVNHQKWLDCNRRFWWCQELIRDLAVKNINEYHKFLWSSHLGYAATYEVALRFGHENVKESRKMFFSDLNDNLIKLGICPSRDITSVFEVGCSLGYQLRHMETDLFSSAARLEGIDIDAYAIQSGSRYLKSIGSKVQLMCADMEELDSLMGSKMYDIIVCSGVLMYLNENVAARVVDTMMSHTKIMLAFTGLAHPDIDNSQLRRSVARDNDQSFIHNIDSMVKKAGGDVIARRWEGSKLVDGHTIYFVFAKRHKNLRPC